MWPPSALRDVVSTLSTRGGSAAPRGCTRSSCSRGRRGGHQPALETTTARSASHEYLKGSFLPETQRLCRRAQHRLSYGSRLQPVTEGLAGVLMKARGAAPAHGGGAAGTSVLRWRCAGAGLSGGNPAPPCRGGDMQAMTRASAALPPSCRRLASQRQCPRSPRRQAPGRGFRSVVARRRRRRRRARPPEGQDQYRLSEPRGVTREEGPRGPGAAPSLLPQLRRPRDSAPSPAGNPRGSEEGS